MNTTTIGLFLRFLVVDVVLDVLRFPLWWYSKGLVRVGRWYVRQLHDGSDRLALGVLAKNLGNPMFGDVTREGRIISFFVRLIQIIVSAILYAGWFLITSLEVLAYIALLPALVAFLLYAMTYV